MIEFMKLKLDHEQMKTKKLSPNQIKLLRVIQDVIFLLLAFAAIRFYQAAKNNAESVQYLDMQNTGLRSQLFAATNHPTKNSHEK